MHQPNPNGEEVSRVLEMMGLTQHYRAGAYRVFLNRILGERVVHFESKWDMPREDVDFFLTSNGLSVEEFWEKFESLYQ